MTKYGVQIIEKIENHKDISLDTLLGFTDDDDDSIFKILFFELFLPRQLIKTDLKPSAVYRLPLCPQRANVKETSVCVCVFFHHRWKLKTLRRSPSGQPRLLRSWHSLNRDMFWNKAERKTNNWGHECLRSTFCSKRVFLISQLKKIHEV